MADTLQFDLVSPERKLASVEASQVQIPGMEGDLTAMPQHSPFLTTLRPGIVRVISSSGTSEYVVTGGFAEISPEATTILAEQAMARDEVDGALLDKVISDAEEARESAPDDARTALDQRVRDTRTLKSALGLT